MFKVIATVLQRGCIALITEVNLISYWNDRLKNLLAQYSLFTNYIRILHHTGPFSHRWELYYFGFQWSINIYITKWFYRICLPIAWHTISGILSGIVRLYGCHEHVESGPIYLAICRRHFQMHNCNCNSFMEVFLNLLPTTCPFVQYDTWWCRLHGALRNVIMFSHTVW